MDRAGRRGITLVCDNLILGDSMRLWMVLLVTFVLGVGLPLAFAAPPAVRTGGAGLHAPFARRRAGQLEGFSRQVGGAVFLSKG